MVNKSIHEKTGKESRYEPGLSVAGWLVVSLAIWVVVLLLITISPYI